MKRGIWAKGKRGRRKTREECKCLSSHIQSEPSLQYHTVVIMSVIICHRLYLSLYSPFTCADCVLVTIYRRSKSHHKLALVPKEPREKIKASYTLTCPLICALSLSSDRPTLFIELRPFCSLLCDRGLTSCQYK